MKNKTKPIIITAVIIGIILLFPICLRLKDGGSKEYRSIVGIYEVKNWKQMGITEDGLSTVKTGITIKLFGLKIFDNTKIEIEHAMFSSKMEDHIEFYSVVMKQMIDE